MLKYGEVVAQYAHYWRVVSKLLVAASCHLEDSSQIVSHSKQERMSLSVDVKCYANPRVDT